MFMNSIDNFFTKEEQERIEAAVKEAESMVSGEIVPVFVKQSDSYPEAPLRAFIFGFMFFTSVVYLIDLWMEWGEMVLLKNSIYLIGSSTLVGIIFAFLVRYLAPLKYYFITRQRMDESVDKLARQTFLEYEVFNTRERTGILLFVSLFEHEVEILGDSGINEKISKNEWEQIAYSMIEQLKKGNRCQAFIEGVQGSRDLLIKYGFEKRPDDKNEISDQLRQN